VLEYLNLFCTQNSYGVYCLELVDEFDSGTLQLPYEDISVSANNKINMHHHFVDVHAVHLFVYTKLHFLHVVNM